MAAQAALVADTIIGMKKALSRDNDCTFGCLLSFLFIFFFCCPDRVLTS